MIAGSRGCYMRYTDCRQVVNGRVWQMLGEGLRSRCVAQIGSVIVIALFLLSGAALLQAQERSKIDCTPSFPFKDSWWGADAAYSIPLPDGRSIWIFGDTLYGDRRVVERN